MFLLKQHLIQSKFQQTVFCLSQHALTRHLKKTLHALMWDFGGLWQTGPSMELQVWVLVFWETSEYSCHSAHVQSSLPLFHMWFWYLFYWKPSMVVNTCHPRTQDAEAEKCAWQPGLRSEFKVSLNDIGKTLSQNKTKQNICFTENFTKGQKKLLLLPSLVRSWVSEIYCPFLHELRVEIYLFNALAWILAISLVNLGNFCYWSTLLSTITIIIKR